MVKKYRYNELEEVKDDKGEVSQLFFYNDFAKISEVELDRENEPMLRFYKSSPEGFTLQIRTFNGIGAKLTSKSKPRNMIANVSIGIEELEKMLEYAKAALNRRG